MKRLKRILLWPLLAAVSLLFLSCSPCFAEAEYRITESELTRLETNLTELSELRQESQNQLAMLKSNLEISRSELSEARQQTMELESKLTELGKTSAEQEQSLLIANERLQKYADEEKRKISRIKRERNIAYGVFVVVAYLYCSK